MLLTMELVGIILAIIDFFGLTPSLETRVDLLRAKLNKLLKNPGFKKLFKIALILALVISSALLVMFLYSWLTMDEFSHECVNTGVSCIFEQAFAMYFYGVFLVIAFMISVTTTILPFAIVLGSWGLLYLLKGFLHLLNKPKVGIVGTFGLLLALMGFIFGRVL